MEERERYLWQVFRECEDYKQAKEARILEVFRFVRALPDKDTVYRATLRHPYAFAAAEAQRSAIYPVLFSADPAVNLVDPNPGNFQRNQTAEKLLTGLIHNPLRTNFPLYYDRMLTDLIWFGFQAPYTFFRTREKMIGPRWVPRVLMDGTPATDVDGNPILEEEYEPVRVYHAPYFPYFDVWDIFLHPDGVRGFIRRDVSGYELRGQSLSSNPVYDPRRVARLIRSEYGRSRKTMQIENFTRGTESMRNRDLMAAEVGAEPLRHDEILNSDWAKDVLAKPFVLLNYDDDEHHGVYAVSSDGSGLMELSFFRGVNYDGSSQRMLVTSNQSPQEVYGTSVLDWSLDLLKLHSKFYQAAADITALTMNPMWLVSQQFRNSGQRIIVGPGAQVPVPSSISGNLEEHIKRLDMPVGAYQPMQFVDTIQRGLDMILAQGNFSRGQFEGGRKTAYETNLVAEGSQGRIEILLKKLNDQFIIPMVRKWLAMTAEHYTARDYVEMLGPEGAEYIPPSRQEIVRGLQYVPKGSTQSANQQVRAAQWPGFLKMLMETLPVMQVPHIHQAVKRAAEDMGLEAVSQVIPALTDPRMTEFQSMILQGLQTQQQYGGPGGGSPPRSPGQIFDVLRGGGGSSAPPGPADGGNPFGGGAGNGAAAQGGGFR